jgi:large subunit ribosomal protein L6
VQGATLNLSLDSSHPILFPIPKEIKITVADGTKLTIQRIDKKLVGQVAQRISGVFVRRSRIGQRRALRRRTNSPQEGKTVQ